MRAEPLRGRLGWGGSKGASGQEELWAAEAGGTSEMGARAKQAPRVSTASPRLHTQHARHVRNGVPLHLSLTTPR